MLLQDLAQLLKTVNQKPSYYAASLTDRFIIGAWGDPDSRSLYEEEQLEKVLELRIFNTDMEMKVWRGDISEPFQIRILDDRNTTTSKKTSNNASATESESFEETQILDIDRFRSSGPNLVRTTGGGFYKLPPEIYQMKNPGLIVRHYFDRCQQTGIAFILDWRCVGFKDMTPEKPEQEGDGGDEQT